VVKGVPPHIMGIGPAMAIPAVLEQCQLTVLEDIDVFEINKAFALQATWCVDVLKIDPSKVNPNGGAIALGHPLGCTGTRQIATLLRKLHRKKKQRFGVVSMCIGMGMGAAVVLEAEPESRL
jgi:acetyl-CoA acyltransferase 1